MIPEPIAVFITLNTDAQKPESWESGIPFSRSMVEKIWSVLVGFFRSFWCFGGVLGCFEVF